MDTEDREDAPLAMLDEDPTVEHVDYERGDWRAPNTWEVEAMENEGKEEEE